MDMPVSFDQEKAFALRLHALHESDRLWILQRVPEQARSRLEALIREIRELGFSPDPSVMLALDRPAGHRDAEAQIVPRAGLFSAVGATRLTDIFKQEPPTIWKVLRALPDWPRDASNSAGGSEEPSMSGVSTRARISIEQAAAAIVESEMPDLARSQPSNAAGPAQRKSFLSRLKLWMR